VIPRYILDEGRQDAAPSSPTSYLSKVKAGTSSKEGTTALGEETSSSDEEVTWNVNEREKRIIQKPATVREDDEFWDSTLHDTWKEDPDDSSISFDSEDEEDAQWQDVGESSMSESVSDEDEGDESDAEESDESLKRRRKPNKYVDPELQPKRKKVRRSKQRVKKKKSETSETATLSRDGTSDGVPSPATTRGGVTTRDTTQAQTVDSSVREADRKHSQEEKRSKQTKRVKAKWPSYDELMQEALRVEVWNTSQLTNYIAYEKELEQIGHHQSSAVKARKKARETQPSIRWTNSAAKADGRVVEELSFHNGADVSAAFPSPPSLPAAQPEVSRRWKYREPLTNEKFDTIGEYKEIRKMGHEKELREFRRALQALEIFCSDD
ncbi:hypothetical protein FOZ62_029489, partial [Perkinsus olseni]